MKKPETADFPHVGEEEREKRELTFSIIAPFSPSTDNSRHGSECVYDDVTYQILHGMIIQSG